MKALVAAREDGNPYITMLLRSLSGKQIEVNLPPRGRFALLRGALKHGVPDVVHLQWHHELFVSGSSHPLKAFLLALQFYLQFVVLRLLGARFVWTVHNIVNHEAVLARWELLNCRILARLAERLIVHCNEVVESVSRAYRVSPKKLRVVPLGDYGEYYSPPAESRVEARRALHMDSASKLILFFGSIRLYKGLQELLEVFDEIPARDARLLIAGNPKSAELARLLEARARDDSRLALDLAYVEDATLVRYLRACDFVVLPYASVLTSSAINLAAALGKCAVIPALGCMKEYPADAMLFYPPESREGLKAALLEALAMSHEELEARGSRAREYVRQAPWSTVASRTIAIYQEIT